MGDDVERERPSETGVSCGAVEAVFWRFSFSILFSGSLSKIVFSLTIFFVTAGGARRAHTVHASRTAAQHRNTTLRAERSYELRDRLSPTAVANSISYRRGTEGQPKHQYCLKMLNHRLVLLPADSLSCEILSDERI